MKTDSSQFPKCLEPINDSIVALLEYKKSISSQEVNEEFRKIVSFLETCDSLQDVTYLKMDPKAKERVNILQDKNNENELNPDEKVALEEYVALGHVVTRIKIETSKIL